jgi:hypothetical protein
MTPIGTRSLWTTLAATVVVGFAASLIGCASAGPLTPVVVSDIKSVAGTWKGVIYQSGYQPDYIVLTIQEDGSYEFTSRQAFGSTVGKGTIVISGGRLIIQGQKGRGVATVLSRPNGDLFMDVQATLSDNSILTAKLSLSP